MELNEKSIKNFKTKIFYVGEVVSIDDPNDTGQIKVRIFSDQNTPIEDLPIALPLLPKYLNIYPKVGERVTVMVPEITMGDQDSNTSTRFWIGPWISQPQKLSGDDFINSYSDRSDGYIKLLNSANKIPTSKGLYPSKEYIAIQGRNNSDMILRDKEVILRSGFFKDGKPTESNDKDSGYVQVRYLTKSDDGIKENSNSLGSNINVVGNYINLFSHKGKNNGINLNEKTKTITPEDQEKMNNMGHPIPYGDILNEFLELVKSIISTHVHPYHGMEAVKDDKMNKLLNFNLDNILNKYVRTN